VTFVPPQRLPLAVDALQPQRVEVRVKPGAVPAAAITGSAVIRTNNPPFTRTVTVFVAGPQPGTIEVDPLDVTFQQRNVEIVDPRGFRTRANCAEVPPATRDEVQGGVFIIRNTGMGTLQICDLQLQDPTGFFQLPPQRRWSLLAGTEVQLPVLLTANTPINRQFSAQVTIVSSDPHTPRLVVALHGEAIDPPRGVAVGGQSAVIDTVFDGACIALRRPPEGPPVIDLDAWRRMFVSPDPDVPGSIDVLSLSLRHAGPEAIVTVANPGGPVFTTHPGPDDTEPALTLMDGQLGRATLGQLDAKETPHLHVLCFALRPVARYAPAALVQSLGSFGPAIAVATTQGIDVVDLSDPTKPRRSDDLPDIIATGFAGRGNALYAVTANGIEVLTMGPPIGHRRAIALAGAQDLAWSRDVFAYALQPGVLVGLGPKPDGLLAEVGQVKVDAAARQVVSLGSRLYLLGNERLTIIDAAAPWSMRVIGEMAMPGANSISRQGRWLVVRDADGTRLLRDDGAGKLVPVAMYPGGHWSDAFIGDRLQKHLFRIVPDRKSIDIWQMRQKRARAG
jgi:hypothetical protein